MPAVADATPNIAAALIDTLISGNRGDRRAFEYAGRTYSYQDVAALMNRTANMFVALGVPAGGRVLLLMPESPAFVASLLGAMKAGAVPVLGVRNDGSDVARCIDVAAPAAAIVHEARLASVEAALGRIPGRAIVVVGGTAHGYQAFVDVVRAQASWLASGPVAPDAPALGVWDGSRLESMSHSDVASFVGGEGTFADGQVAEAARVGAMLLAFATGESVALTSS
jgi:non-ribosomal peptide synthetase component E (peptide arylation enzyme)